MNSSAQLDRSCVPSLNQGRVVNNFAVCSEHYVMTLAVRGMGSARPGQFVHLGVDGQSPNPRTDDGRSKTTQHNASTGQAFAAPFLRRAFSIASLSRQGDVDEIQVLYRTVGVGTRWLAERTTNDTVSVMGPLGNGFETPTEASRLLLVAGGVGLPPLLCLAESVRRHGGRVVGVCGAVSADFVAAPEAHCADSINQLQEVIDGSVSDAGKLPMWLVATDDGTRGFPGNAVQALRALYDRFGSSLEGWSVCTCGPEAMMRAVGEFCAERAIGCVACLERAMSCGTGTCQSCVVALRDPAEPDGWRYQLCCTDGPVFDASHVIW